MAEYPTKSRATKGVISIKVTERNGLVVGAVQVDDCDQMGFGLPAALGVKMALPEETVVCVTGDGSIQMNIQELSTALQYELPVLVVNLNNRYLGMVKQWQDMIYSGRHSQSYY